MTEGKRWSEESKRQESKGNGMLRETHKDREGVRKKGKEGERKINTAEQKIGSSRFSRHKKLLHT